MMTTDLQSCLSIQDYHGFCSKDIIGSNIYCRKNFYEGKNMVLLHLDRMIKMIVQNILNLFS